MKSELIMIVSFVIQFILLFFIVMHGLYLFLLLLGALSQKNYHKSIHYGEFKSISESPLSLPISVVICAFNEEKLIINTVLNALQLRYPQHELIVVNDGSLDSTLQLLIDRFELHPINMVFKKHFETQPVRAVYRSLKYPNLLVVDKVNGRRADANNVGAEFSKYPIICQIDADCVLEEDALLHMIRPFLQNGNVVAATGIVRPSNGLVIDQGRIVSRDLPSKWIATFQVVEYLRAFQWARAGLTKLKSLLSMSGAFTVVRKDIYFKVGGADTTAIVDDFELTVDIQRYIHEHPELGKMEMAYVPDPGCYTEVPQTLKAFASQRRVWQAAIFQSMIWNSDMAFNPRYGLVGMFGVPFFMIFEVFSAIVEGCAYLLAPIAYYLGLATLTDIALLFVFGIVLASFISICAILLQVNTRLREQNTRNLLRLILVAFIENIGFHQIHVVYRLVGIFNILTRQRVFYGYRERYGYKTPN